MNSEQAKQVWRDGLYDVYCYWSVYVNHCVTPLNKLENFFDMINFNEYMAGKNHLEPLAKPVVFDPHEAPEAGEQAYD